MHAGLSILSARLSVVNMSECSGFTDELDSVLEHESITEFDTDYNVQSDASIVHSAKESAANDAEDECSHPVIFNSMCATYDV